MEAESPFVSSVAPTDFAYANGHRALSTSLHHCRMVHGCFSFHAAAGWDQKHRHDPTTPRRTAIEGGHFNLALGCQRPLFGCCEEDCDFLLLPSENFVFCEAVRSAAAGVAAEATLELISGWQNPRHSSRDEAATHAVAPAQSWITFACPNTFRIARSDSKRTIHARKITLFRDRPRPWESSETATERKKERTEKVIPCRGPKLNSRTTNEPKKRTKKTNKKAQNKFVTDLRKFRSKLPRNAKGKKQALQFEKALPGGYAKKKKNTKEKPQFFFLLLFQKFQ